MSERRQELIEELALKGIGSRDIVSFLRRYEGDSIDAALAAYLDVWTDPPAQPTKGDPE